MSDAGAIFRAAKPRSTSALSEVLPRIQVAAPPAWLERSAAERPPPATPAAPPESLDAVIADARAKGEREGIEAGRTKVNALMERYFNAIIGLERATKETRKPFAKEAVELGLTIAREILEREISVDGAALKARLEEALGAIGPEGPIRVRLGPTEIEHAVQRAPELVSSVELVEDETLGVGGCVVESPRRVIDASISTRLAAIRTALEDAWARGDGTHDL
jgi:flagellar assembly protein FliH